MIARLCYLTTGVLIPMSAYQVIFNGFPIALAVSTVVVCGICCFASEPTNEE